MANTCGGCMRRGRYHDRLSRSRFNPRPTYLGAQHNTGPVMAPLVATAPTDCDARVARVGLLLHDRFGFEHATVRIECRVDSRRISSPTRVSQGPRPGSAVQRPAPQQSGGRPDCHHAVGPVEEIIRSSHATLGGAYGSNRCWVGSVVMGEHLGGDRLPDGQPPSLGLRPGLLPYQVLAVGSADEPTATTGGGDGGVGHPAGTIAVTA